MQASAATPTSAAPLLIEPVLRYAQPVRIALPDFLASSPAEADPAQPVSQIITANLKRSEQFALIDQTAFTEKITNFLLATSHLQSSGAQSEKYAGGRHCGRC
jgi:TolB protein